LEAFKIWSNLKEIYIRGSRGGRNSLPAFSRQKLFVPGNTCRGTPAGDSCRETTCRGLLPGTHAGGTPAGRLMPGDSTPGDSTPGDACRGHLPGTPAGDSTPGDSTPGTHAGGHLPGTHCNAMQPR